MNVVLVILLIGLAIFIAHLFTLFFKHTSVPDVLLLIAIGIVIGPLMGWITAAEIGEAGSILTTVTLIAILFYWGVKMNVRTLKKYIVPGIKLTVLNFVATFGIVSLVSWKLMGFGAGPAMILGSIACGTGAAIVIPLVYQLSIGGESRTMLFMESAFSDTLCILITLAVIGSVRTGELHIVGIVTRIVESLVFAIVLGVLGALAWSAILKRVRELQNPILITMAFLFIMFGVVEIVGYSGAVASLAFGIALGNIEYLKDTRLGKYVHIPYTPLTATEMTVFSELVYILKSFFFIYVGISIELSNIQSMYTGLILILLILASRIPIVWLSIPKSISSHDAAIISAMGSKGIAAAFLAPIPAQQGLASGNIIESLTYSIILVSIIMCSLLIFLIDRTPASSVYGYIFRGFGKKD